jgi:hypothetical protein
MLARWLLSFHCQSSHAQQQQAENERGVFHDRWFWGKFAYKIAAF